MQSIMSTWSARYPTFSIWISSLNFKLLAAAVHSDKFNGQNWNWRQPTLLKHPTTNKLSKDLNIYQIILWHLMWWIFYILSKKKQINKLPTSQIFHATTSYRQKRSGAPNCWCDGRICHHLCWSEGWRPWQTDRFAWSPEFGRVVFGWGFSIHFYCVCVWGKA